MKSTATLQNNVRLRIFLILALSIGIRIARTYASESVHKATAVLEFNYILYGAIMLCSLMPFKSTWGVAFVCGLCAVILGGGISILSSISTYRCLKATQPGCVQTAPGSVISLLLALVIVGLDILQCWTIYLILKYPSFISSASQRIRILFAWAFPFAWLVNIVLLIESEWTVIVTPHLIIDPTVIILANSDEYVLLSILVGAVLVSDMLALLFVDISVVRTAITAQIVLSTGAALLICLPVERVKIKNDSDETTDISTENETQASSIKTKSPDKVNLRQKSATKKIKF